MPSQHDSLRNRKEQHKPKNIQSKNDDKKIYHAMENVKKYLEDRFREQLVGYEIEVSKKLEVKYMINFIKSKGLRIEFDESLNDRTIRPDGGGLFLKKQDNSLKKPILISEIKRQGTNKQRIQEGLKKQATGNAIERLGKNLIGIRAMMNHEKITPFICFGWGEDFVDKTVLSKVLMMNEFYPLNKTHVFKRDGDSTHNLFSPISIYCKEEEWTVEEMENIMKEIAETAIRYYIF